MKQTKILIVEDEGIVAEDIQSRLQHRGYKVVGKAVSGEEAIQLAEDEKPDLVLMDIRLKGEMDDGIEAARQIRTRFDIPVIYLTAYADEDTIQRAKLTEPFGYLLKPFEERELHTAIEMALYKHKMEKKLRKSEENYCGLFDNAILGIYRITLDDEILMANPAFVQMLGYDSFEELAQEFQGDKGFYCIDYPRHELKEQIRKEGKLLSVKSAWIRKDDCCLYTRENVKVALDSDGNVMYMEGIVEDISAQKKAEEERRASQELLQKTLDKLSEAVLIIDAVAAEVTYANSSASEIFGEIDVSHSAIDDSLIIISAKGKKKSC